jgi:polysaccharide biosynthesis/export protein
MAANIQTITMKKAWIDRWHVVVITFLILHFCVPASPQDKSRNTDLGTAARPSQAGQTGTGLQGRAMTGTESGQADGVGNPRLGGRHPLYRLNRSDVVAVSFTLSPEFDQTLTIQPDGYVTLKDAGAVLAQGLGLEEFREAVQRAYAGYLHDPQVAVTLKEFEHPYFIAGGEIGKPGKYELRADTTIVEAVEIAGGFTHAAKHSQVLLFRHVNDDHVEAHAFDLKKLLRQKNSEVAYVRPGDLVFVPQNSISKIAPLLTRPSLSMYISSTQF